MANWNHRWVCPHWEFFAWQQDAPDIPFAERSRESTSTFLNLMNPFVHNVDVRVDFYDSQGNVDSRFGLEGIVSGRAVWKYRVDSGGPNFPKPPAGVEASGRGWFKVLASHQLLISVHVTGEKYNHHPRAWGFCVPVYEWPFPPPIRITFGRRRRAETDLDLPPAGTSGVGAGEPTRHEQDLDGSAYHRDPYENTPNR